MNYNQSEIAYGLTEVFVKHEYFSNLRVKLVRKENEKLLLQKDNADSCNDLWEVKTSQKLYNIPKGFFSYELDENYFYFYEEGDYSILRYKYILHRGSSRSSKTWSLCESAIRDCETKDNFRINIWRDTRESLGNSVWKDFRKIYPLSGREYKFPQKTTPIFFGNGSIIEPHGDDTTNAHGVTQDKAWLNEPYRMSKETFDQIDQRANQIIIDINPSGKHWSDKLDNHPRCIVIHSTFKENPFCPKEQKEKLLSYEPWLPGSYEIRGKEIYYNDKVVNDLNTPPKHPFNVVNQTADEYMWMSYGLGLLAEKPNRIFRGWNKILLDEFLSLPYNSYYGLDFGTTNPSGLVEVKYNDGCFFIMKRLYKPMSEMNGHNEGFGLSNEFESLKIKKNDIVIADSADKENRLDLQRNGYNVLPARKGSDSVLGGINLINKFKIYYVEDEDLENEYESYEWEIVNGVNLDRPIKKDDHLLDAFRYVLTWLCTYLSIK